MVIVTQSVQFYDLLKDPLIFWALRAPVTSQ